MQYAVIITARSAESSGTIGTISLITNTPCNGLHFLLAKGSRVFGRELNQYIERIQCGQVEGLTLTGAFEFDSDTIYEIVYQQKTTVWPSGATAEI